MTTTHEFMAETALERFEEGSDGFEVLMMARRGLREGQWNDEYLSAIGQYPQISPAGWPMEQIAAFIEVHTMIMGGSVAELLITLGEGPGRDADRESNAAVLARLPHPFRAAVDMRQHNARGDGMLTWTCPIPVSLSTGLIARHEDGSTHPLPVRFNIPPGRAVLEIGTTKPSTTWEHLIKGRAAVARWPYNSTRLRLLVNLNAETYWSSRMVKALAPYRKARV